MKINSTDEARRCEMGTVAVKEGTAYVLTDGNGMYRWVGYSQTYGEDRWTDEHVVGATVLHGAIKPRNILAGDIVTLKDLNDLPFGSVVETVHVYTDGRTRTAFVTPDGLIVSVNSKLQCGQNEQLKVRYVHGQREATSREA